MNFKPWLVCFVGVTILTIISIPNFWIVNPSNIGDYLSLDGKTLLDINGNEKEWKILYEKHKSNNNPPTVTKLLSYDIGNNENKGIEQLKVECEKLFKDTTLAGEEFKNKREKAINWCIFESPMLKESKNS